MRLFVLLASLALTTFPALAQTNSLPSHEIERRLTADGYRIVQFERYSDTIEVRAFDTGGACVELHLNPSSGAIQHRGSDDRCTGTRVEDHGRRRERHGHHGGHMGGHHG